MYAFCKVYLHILAGLAQEDSYTSSLNIPNNSKLFQLYLEWSHKNEINSGTTEAFLITNVKVIAYKLAYHLVKSQQSNHQ